MKLQELRILNELKKLNYEERNKWIVEHNEAQDKAWETGLINLSHEGYVKLNWGSGAIYDAVLTNEGMKFSLAGKGVASFLTNAWSIITSLIASIIKNSITR